MNTDSHFVIGLACLFTLAACSALPCAAQNADSGAARPGISGRVDSHSYGNPEQVRILQLELDMTVDFEEHRLKGIAVLEIQRQPGCPLGTPLVLDTQGLSIEKVEVRRMRRMRSDPFEPVPFHLDPPDPILGSKLTITLTPTTMLVRIWYQTSSAASALQWLLPARTLGKKKPFVFTQSQAIHARSWIPLQDSPGARVSFTATIHVPPGLTAVMGAESRVNAAEAALGTFRYRLPQSIPPYLIAMAAGDLSFKMLGRRTGVWAEPATLEAAAYEFAELEEMVAAAEKRFGPYRWGRFDVLVLPPSFPLGGMENPRLAFVTPTILAGDRSLVSLIAHELAHAWSGNLVSNATWRDFWLNEGFTTYLERRIIVGLYGRERADMEAVIGFALLRDEVYRLPPRDQILHIDLKGRDPDEAVTEIPYEKGALFVSTIERAFGRERFDAFLKDYFEAFRFQSITTAQFVAFLDEKLLRDDSEAATIVDLDRWIEKPGIPKAVVVPTSERLDVVDRQRVDWLGQSLSARDLAGKDWSTQEWVRFLHPLPAKLPLDRLAALDHEFGLTQRKNAEVAHEWLLVAIKNGYQPADARLEAYLTSIGRRKLVLPLYRTLIATPAGRRRAQSIYAKARPFYHPITVEAIDTLMKKGK